MVREHIEKQQSLKAALCETPNLKEIHLTTSIVGFGYYKNLLLFMRQLSRDYTRTYCSETMLLATETRSWAGGLLRHFLGWVKSDGDGRGTLN